MAHADADLELDFYADWMATIRGALQALSYQPPADDQDATIAYFNVLKRLVPARPRRVAVAPSLLCPPEVRAGYDEVTRKVIAGESLRPHLSRRLADRDFSDLLLNDWGIHHLHLGTVVQADGFVTRTGPVLFARFLADDAYFIAVPKHGAWSEVQILELFAASWPDQMARYELRGVAPSRDGKNPTSQEIHRARSGGVQVLITIAGKVYFPMGGGINTAAGSMEVVHIMDQSVMRVRAFEENVVRAKDEIFAKAAEHGVLFDRPMKLKMVVRQDGSARAITADRRFGFPLGAIT